jgi:glycosyltransferase involved in cell wall biosynthesis
MLGIDSITSNQTPLNTGISSNDARQRFVAGLVSVIIRAHKACDKRLLQQSLHSLATQTYSSIEVVIATDSFESTHLQELANAIGAESWNPKAQARVESIDCSDLTDTRSRLLNEGIKRSKGQYLAFLDYDDIVYDEAYKSLIEELETSGKGVAAGGTRVAEVTWKDGVLEVENYREFPHDGKSKIDLWKGNFLPIHSFVIDRYVVLL